MASNDKGGVRVAGPGHVETGDGDDIVVVPGDAPEQRSRRPWFVIAAVAAVALVAGVIVVATRGSGSKATVQPIGNATTQQSAPARRPSVATSKAKSQTVHPKKATRAKHTPTSVIGKPAAVQPSPAIAPAPTTPAPKQGDAPTTTLPKQSDPHVLQWTIHPSTMTIPTGQKLQVAINVRNPSDGVVDLPHPLSCAPRLDHSEICSEQTQEIGPGQVATAQWTIDATNVVPNEYTLIVEGGLVTIKVTVNGTTPTS